MRIECVLQIDLIEVNVLVEIGINLIKSHNNEKIYALEIFQLILIEFKP